MRWFGLRVYAGAAVVVLILSVSIPWALASLLGEAGVVSLTVLGLSVQVILGVGILAQRMEKARSSLSRELEASRSRLNWRIEYEARTLFNSTRRLREPDRKSFEQLVEFARGTRLQGDRLVRGMHRQDRALEDHGSQIRALRELVVELVARGDAGTDGSLEGAFERALALDIGLNQADKRSDHITGSSQSRV